MIVKSKLSQKSVPMPNLAATAGGNTAECLVRTKHKEVRTQWREKGPYDEKDDGIPVVAL